MKQKLITTQKWRPSSRTTKQLPIRVYKGSQLFNIISKYKTPSQAIFYQSCTDGKDFDVDFNPHTGVFRKTSIQKNNGRTFIDLAFAIRMNLAIPAEFKKATEISEGNVSFGKDKFRISLATEEKRKQPSKPISATDDKKLDQIIDMVYKLGASVYSQQPALDTDELSKSLSDELVAQITDTLSAQLATEIMAKLTRSDDFMNRLAETVGFKLASTISTRMNRLEESLKSLSKEQTNKAEKNITHNVYDLFKEAGWLK